MRYFIALCMLAAGIFMTNSAMATVNVFACVPEWGALAEEIGGDDVSVYTGTNAKQNVHYFSAKPSLLSKMRKADLVFCNGASLEIGWLPLLMQKAAGPDVQIGKPGYLLAADQVDKLDIPEKIDRSQGDVHPEGNPHIHLDPSNILIVAGVLAERLATIDPENAPAYKARLEVFQKRWTILMSRWENQAASLRGKNVVVYHINWAYLLNWLGINHIASLEPKPGLPPTASHLENVLQTVKGRKVHAILVSPFENEKAARWLSEKTGIPIVHLPFTVGGNDKADNLENLFTETIRLLNEAPL